MFQANGIVQVSIIGIHFVLDYVLQVIKFWKIRTTISVLLWTIIRNRSNVDADIENATGNTKEGRAFQKVLLRIRIRSSVTRIRTKVKILMSTPIRTKLSARFSNIGPFHFKPIFFQLNHLSNFISQLQACLTRRCLFWMAELIDECEFENLFKWNHWW